MSGKGKKMGVKRSATKASIIQGATARKKQNTNTSARTLPHRAATTRGVSLNEDNLAAATSSSSSSLSPEVEDERKRREFWEQFDTPLLHVWLNDYEIANVEKIKASDRDRIIVTLVTEEVPLINMTTKASLTRMQALFKRKHPATPAARMPGLYDHAAAVEDSDVDMEADSSEGELQDENGANSEEEDTTPARRKRKASAASLPPLSITRMALSQPTTAAAAATTVGTDSALPRTLCLTCAAPPPSGIGAWRCSGCSLRGDLPSSHEANQILLLLSTNTSKVAAATAAAAAAASSSTTSASSSTSLSSTSIGQSLHEKHQTKLDRSFEQMLREGAPTAAAEFQDTTPVTPSQALLKLRQAYNSRAYHQTSEKLREVIRAHKLKEVGFALPIRIGEVKEDTTSLTLVSGNTILAQSKNGIAVAPPIQSPIQFFKALLCTILPSLFDRPNAMLQWLSLVKTMFEIEMETNDWSKAMLYLSQALHESVSSGTQLAECDTNHIRVIIDRDYRSSTVTAASGYPSLNGGGGASLVQRSASVATLAGGATTHGKRVCRDYNYRVCTRMPCSFAHECKYHLDEGKDCGGRHPATQCIYYKPSVGTLGAQSVNSRQGRQRPVASTGVSTVISSTAATSKQ
jgi:hypothetical protein